MGAEMVGKTGAKALAECFAPGHRLVSLIKESSHTICKNEIDARSLVEHGNWKGRWRSRQRK